MSGCSFAASMAKPVASTSAQESRIAVARMEQPLTSATPHELSEFFVGAAHEGRAAVAVFPKLGCEAEVVALLRTLAQGGERWSVSEHVSDSNDGILVSVRWRTDHGDWSSTMGLAPLPAMPVTRRAPFVALAAWPGAPGKRRGSKGSVGFIDMPSGLDPAAHKAALQRSMKETEDRLGIHPDKGPWRDVAFCLHESSRAALDSATNRSLNP